MKNAAEMTEALRCKLRTFGVPIEGPTSIFCDHGAVRANTRRPKLALTKKHCSIACHWSRDAAAAGTVRTLKERALTDLADTLAWTVAAQKREELLDSFAHLEASWSARFCCRQEGFPQAANQFLINRSQT